MKQHPFWHYLIIFIAMQVLGMVVGAFTGLSGVVEVLLGVNLLTIVATLCYMRRISLRGTADGITTVLLVLLAPPSIFIVTWVQEMLPSLPDLMTDNIYDELLTTPLGLFTVCLLGPLCEELVFRAGVLGSLLHGRSHWIAIAISAAIFAIIHFNPVQMPAAFCLGFLLGYAYWRTQSIIAPLLIHIFNNSIAAIYPDISVSSLLPSPLHHIVAIAISITWFVIVIYALKRR